MTNYSWADLGEWARKVEKRKMLIVRQATEDVFALASRRATGVTRGGSIKEGHVPVDTGFLSNTAVSRLQGSTMLTGPSVYTLVAAGMSPGDVAEMGWTAEYARAVHYRGWLWVDNAAVKWPSIVREAIRRARQRYR